MAFDRTDPADLLALKNEQAIDPINMGYAAVDGQVKKTMDLFNLGENNVGGETTGALTVRSLFSAIAPDDMSAQQVDSGKLSYISALLTRELDEDIAEFLPQITTVFDQGAAITLANLNAALRLQSRAEVLFGLGTILSKEDWFAARDS